MKHGINLYILFQFGFLAVSGSFIIYNTLFPVYKKLRNGIQRHITDNQIDTSEKKLIISTPAGLHGFYSMGVTAYLKENYDLSECIFSGASAGAWNSLFLCFKGNNTEFINTVLSSDIGKAKSINQIERIMSNSVYEKYKNSQHCFSLNKISIGVTIYYFPFRFRLKIYNDFKNLDDVIECCVASSHIPFITGNLLHRYRNLISFDGGFFNYPYLNTTTPTLIISPNMWGSNFTKTNSYQNPLKFSKQTANFTRLYQEGYDDSKKNKEYLNRFLKLRDK